jgi:hypothetical protein
VPARFTYVYEKVNGTYKILTHHSSVLPEGATLVFYEWNDALMTKDPKAVAAMYDAKGVLVGGDAPLPGGAGWARCRAGACCRCLLQACWDGGHVPTWRTLPCRTPSAAAHPLQQGAQHYI